MLSRIPTFIDPLLTPEYTTKAGQVSAEEAPSDTRSIFTSRL